jgi:glucokinase-like ROK family protein
MSVQKTRLGILKGHLIVSCQASDGDAFRDSILMARFAQAALAGGAVGLRANGPKDIRAIRAITTAPILGIHKELHDDGKILITPSFERAKALVEAGADIVALDVTARGQRFGARELLWRIRAELGVPVVADIATVEEALQAIDAGADAVSSTLRGYTEDTAYINKFEPAFIAELARVSSVPVIAEGRIQSPEDARAAIESGAFAIVVGSAITRPHEITQRFAMAGEQKATMLQQEQYFLGIDLGGTNTKFGIVSSTGNVLFESSLPTPAKSGQLVILDHLASVAKQLFMRSDELNCKPHALGVATAGWVDTDTGSVAYATNNIPEWSGTRIAQRLSETVRIPIAIENDANASALAESVFGAGRGLRNFVCITLGTGIGGGCFIDGKLNSGAHFFANAIGHINLVPDGLACTCGKRGCLEAYTNAAALLSYAEVNFSDPEKLISAANVGDSAAISAIRKYAHYLAYGCSTVLNLLDPEALILSGGLVQNNPLVIEELHRKLSEIVFAWEKRSLSILVSPLGYNVGMIGAAAVAMKNTYPGEVVVDGTLD